MNIINTMISNILILKTEKLEEERKLALDNAYDEFINKINNETIERQGRQILFLKIDLREGHYSDNEAYLLKINADSNITKYGISCSEISNRINELMKSKNEPYRCHYAIDWYSGKGITGFFKRLQCKYPYVKSVNFMLNTVSYYSSESSCSQ